MSRTRNNGAPGPDRDPSAPRTRKPKTPADPAIAPDGNAPGASTNDHRKDARSGSRDANYAVGYGRPPRQHRFKSGQSGNPRGRPKGVRSEADILNALLNKKITIQERGRPRQISVLDAIYHRIAQNGLKGGDTKSATFLLNRMAAVAQRSGDQSTEMNEDDRAVLESFVAQIINSQQDGGSK
jgi:hypothetical protein